MNVRDRIRQRLDETDQSMKAASKAAGLGETAIRDILKNDTQSPKLSTLRKLAPVLETSVEWLSEGVGERQVDPQLGELIDFWHEDFDEEDRTAVLDFAKYRAQQK